MNFILVWVLVSVSYSNEPFVQYSAPLLTQNECVKLKANVDEMKPKWLKTKCVQINMAVTK